MMANKLFNEPEPENMSPTVPTAVEDDFMLLMSLALDEMLDAEEEARFQDYLVTYPALTDEWLSWQELDFEMQSTPSALPPVNFVEMFELSLLQRERRRRLWWGVGLGSLVVLLWLGVIAGTMSLGAFVMFGQSAWLTELVRNAAHIGASMNSSLVIAINAVASVFSTEQAQTFVLLYVAAAALMLTGWVFLLRRTTRYSDAAHAVHS